jgi:hypothetical protein
MTGGEAAPSESGRAEKNQKKNRLLTIPPR